MIWFEMGKRKKSQMKGTLKAYCCIDHGYLKMHEQKGEDQ